jgi:hypothetical protein
MKMIITEKTYKKIALFSKTKQARLLLAIAEKIFEGKVKIPLSQNDKIAFDYIVIEINKSLRAQENANIVPAKIINRKEYENLWNEFAKKHSLSIIRALTPSRARKLSARLKEGMNFKEVLKAIPEQPFLLGFNKRNWEVSFDFIVENDKNYLKILERKYGNSKVDINREKKIIDLFARAK